MSSRVAFPFLTLGEKTVAADSWMLVLDDGEQAPAEDYLSDWDYASRISLQRAVSIDRDRAAMDLGIEQDDLRLALCVRVGTGAGRLPRSIISQQLRSFDEGADTVVLDLEVPGQVLSSVLDLMTEIVIEQAPARSGALSPSKSCERVWHDTHRVRLEGEEPRFPIEVADFANLLAGGIAGSAPWYVHWSPSDWSRDFHGSLRLFLNRDHPAFIERVQKGDPETLRAIMADVMGQVCERFVSLDECKALAPAFEPGSLGAQAVSWIRAAWPDRDINFVQSQLKSRPGTFRAAMHALAEQRGNEQ
ncbi:hypothetical protein OKA06_04385 [Novosphingobium sp. MW5]|nr:hypothetical protein [Novosphingobium sp. MW5]